jgi:hypothetical protein
MRFSFSKDDGGLGYRAVGYLGELDSEKKKLIDIGLRRVSLDIEQSYWTVISGYWILRLLILVNQLVIQM